MQTKAEYKRLSGVTFINARSAKKIYGIGAKEFSNYCFHILIAMAR
jgi:hypothetical protein